MLEMVFGVSFMQLSGIGLSDADYANQDVFIRLDAGLKMSFKKVL